MDCFFDFIEHGERQLACCLKKRFHIHACTVDALQNTHLMRQVQAVTDNVFRRCCHEFRLNWACFYHGLTDGTTDCHFKRLCPSFVQDCLSYLLIGRGILCHQCLNITVTVDEAGRILHIIDIIHTSIAIFCHCQQWNRHRARQHNRAVRLFPFSTRSQHNGIVRRVQVQACLSHDAEGRILGHCLQEADKYGIFCLCLLHQRLGFAQKSLLIHKLFLPLYAYPYSWVKHNGQEGVNFLIFLQSVL